MSFVSWSYHNPVQVKFGAGEAVIWAERSQSVSTLLVTSRGWLLRERGKIVLNQLEPSFVISDVPPNPDFSFFHDCNKRIQNQKFDVIVALGGGSCIDTAKVLALRFCNSTGNSLYHYLVAEEKLEVEKVVPIVAIPTTAGTGSEVTPWATIWDFDNKVKYSLSRDDLWPREAILDPVLLHSAPDQLLRNCALDALSHSLESLWNKNRNPVSTIYAVKAAQLIIESLPNILEGRRSHGELNTLLMGSLLAGKAFSNTKTAIAHALSYPLTAGYGVAHGLACAFTLPAILEDCLGRDATLDHCFCEIFGKDPHEAFSKWFERIGISQDWEQFSLQPGFLKKILEEVSTNPRAQNYLFSVDTLGERW
jgi:alcohol dehydrogenase